MNPSLDSHLALSEINPYADPWYRFARVIRLVERHTPNVSKTKWLDLGSQIGQFLKLLKTKHDIAATGIDNFDRHNVVEVCRKYLDLDIQTPDDVFDDSWRYFSRALDKTGIAIEETFDFVSALEVLEHMVDTDAFLLDCRKHLRPGGYLVLSTPNINSLRNRVQVPFGVYPAGLEYRNVIHHVRLYNLSTLRAHLKEHQFEVIAVSGANFVPARLLKHSLCRQLDTALADAFPQLCGTIIVLARAH